MCRVIRDLEEKMCSMKFESQVGWLTVNKSGGMDLATREEKTLICDIKIHQSVMK